MIEITDAAADKIRDSLAEGRVVRMFLAAIDDSGANYGLGMGMPEEDDQLFESNGITIHMSSQDSELLGETIIDFIEDDIMGNGFVIQGPESEMACGCCHDSCEDDSYEGSGCGCH
ncbi:MAG: adhesin [Methanotrichaceae archaeon]|nr:adhesin [Methanotrichaceae archaeon]